MQRLGVHALSEEQPGAQSTSLLVEHGNDQNEPHLRCGPLCTADAAAAAVRAAAAAAVTPAAAGSELCDDGGLGPQAVQLLPDELLVAAVGAPPQRAGRHEGHDGQPEAAVQPKQPLRPVVKSAEQGMSAMSDYHYSR